MNGSKVGLIAGLIGLSAGGALMYWFDPTNGKRRRAHARYQTRRVARRVQKAADATSRGLTRVSRTLRRIEIADVAHALVPATARAFIGR
jgi:hypothetical protein